MVNDEIIAHSSECGENESCGFVVRNDSEDRYIRCKNISSTPHDNFEISADEWIAAENNGNTIVAVVHSHPNGIPLLSKLDQQSQQMTAVDWWLACNGNIYKFRYMPPLLGREFKHGITDCYTLMRDAYHLAGINLPDFHRDDGWWDHGQNLYLNNISDHGFFRVDSPQPGDVILICVGSSTPNHAAIYCGDQYILHHSPKRNSKRDLFDGFWLKYTHSIWRHKNWQSYGFTAISNNLELNIK